MLINKLQWAFGRLRATLKFPSKNYVSSWGTTRDGRLFYIRLERQDKSGRFDLKKESLNIDTIAAVIDPKFGDTLVRNHTDRG